MKYGYELTREPSSMNITEQTSKYLKLPDKRAHNPNSQNRAEEMT